MNFLKIDGLERFFQDGHEGFVYTYYHGTHPLEVYLEYDIIMDAKYIYRYSLTEDRGVWLFVTTSQVSVGWDTNRSEPQVEIAGYTCDSAVQFMINKILSKPRNHTSAQVDTDALKTVLQKVLKRT